MLGDEMNSYAGFLPKGHERAGNRYDDAAEAAALGGGGTQELGATLHRRLNRKWLSKSNADQQRTG